MRRKSVPILPILILPLLFMYNNCTGGLESKFSSLSSESALSSEQTAAFSKAVAVMNKHCVSCHSPSGTAGHLNLNLNKQEEFVRAGLVVAGSPDSSLLMSRLVHYQGPMGGARNMPPAGNFLIEDYQVLSTWIAGMGSSSPSNPQLTANDLFQCDGAAVASVNPLNRLTKLELTNTYKDLLARIPKVNTATIMGLLQPDLLTIPADDGEKYERNDRRLFKAHVDAHYKLAETFSQSVGEAALIDAFAPTCVGSVLANSKSCQTAVIKGFGLQVFRRPLTPAEVADLQAFYLAQGNDLKVVVHRMLMAPEFHYHIETQGSGVDSSGDILRLTPYELASRISYLYLQSMPTPQLFQMAQTGELATDIGIQKAVDHLFRDKFAQVRSTIRHFYSQWMMLSSRPQFNSTNVMTELLKAYPQVGPPDEALRQEFLNELLDLTDHYTFVEKSPFSQILLTDRSFAKSARLASLYNVPIVTTSQPDVRFPAKQRTGLFTRAGLLYSGTDHTRPILVGVSMIRNFKCDTIGDPPSDLINEDRHIDTTTMTTREATEAITHKPACIGCHSKINPFGFAMETYDFLGGFRSDKTESLFDANGQFLQKKPINSVADVEVRPGVYMTVNDGVELNQRLAEHKAVHRCFIQNVYENSLRRPASFSNDGCGMRDLYKKMEESGGNLEQMFRAIPLDMNFKLKKVK